MICIWSVPIIHMQKPLRVEISKEKLDNVAENPAFIKHIITGDETWVYQCDVEIVTVQQSREWRPKNKIKPNKPKFV